MGDNKAQDPLAEIADAKQLAAQAQAGQCSLLLLDHVGHVAALLSDRRLLVELGKPVIRARIEVDDQEWRGWSLLRL